MTSLAAPPLSAVDILRAARSRIIDPKDWRKGFDAYPTETRCVSEAIGEYAGHTLANLRARRAFCRAADIPDGDIVFWNDAPERTHAQVIAAFNLAIASVKL